jgi:hypothetical protein
MPTSEYRARQIGAKTHEVYEYDHDDSKPGKPLHIMVPGGLVALGSLGVIILVAYLTWFEGQLDEGTGISLILLLSPFYVGGVFLFSYGYELYDVPRAIRLTAIIVFVTVAAVVIVAVLFFVLGESKGGGSRSSGSRSKSVSSSSKTTQSSTSSSRGLDVGDLVILGGGGRTHTREVTKEVVKEVEVPVAPRSVSCPNCNRAYVPSNEDYVCPSCGAPTPEQLIVESEKPRKKE